MVDRQDGRPRPPLVSNLLKKMPFWRSRLLDDCLIAQRRLGLPRLWGSPHSRVKLRPQAMAQPDAFERLARASQLCGSWEGTAFPCLYIAQDFDTTYRGYFGGPLTSRPSKLMLSELAFVREEERLVIDVPLTHKLLSPGEM